MMRDDPVLQRAMGQRLQWARELVEPNRTRFARRLMVDPSTIRNIESGVRGPSVQMLRRIMHALRVDFGYVADGRLNGIDSELAVLLATQHPELLQMQPPIVGSRRRDWPDDTYPPPRIRGESADIWGR